MTTAGLGEPREGGGLWNSDGSAALTNTRIGFVWGAAVVERLMDDRKAGTVIRIGTEHGGWIVVRVSAAGRVVELMEWR